MMTKVYGNIFWLLFSLIVCFESFHLKMGDFHQPGPGFFPFGLGILTGLFALIGLYQSLTEAVKKEAVISDRSFRWSNTVTILLAIALYAFLLEKVGFVLTTFFFMVLLLRVVIPQPWKIVLLGATLTALGVNVIFNVLLKVQIPSGIWGF